MVEFAWSRRCEHGRPRRACPEHGALVHRDRRLRRGAAVRLGFGAVALGFVTGLPVLSGVFSPASDAAVTVTLQAFPTGTPCSFEDSWQAPRGTDANGRPLYHEGVDVIAKSGTPIYAAAAGRITRMNASNRGGTQLYITLPDGSYLFHAHLSAYAAGLTVGTNVAAGQLVAYVGQTGDAQYSVPHLHFEVHPGGGAPINPFPLVKAVDGCSTKKPTGTTVATTAPPATTAPTPRPPGRKGTTSVGTIGGSIVRGATGTAAPPPTDPPSPSTPVTPTPTTPAAPVEVGPPGGLVPLAPSRLGDSRGRFWLHRNAGGESQPLTVAGRGGVASDASSAFLTFTVANPGASGYLTAYPCGGTVPATSTVNFVGGQTVSNSALVGLGTSGSGQGKVCIRTNVATDVVVDVSAYASAVGPLGFVPQAPRRLVDTRETADVVPGAVLEVPVGAPGASAVTVNVTSVGADSAGTVTVWPCSQAQPTSPSLTVGGGDIVPNTATVGLGAEGTLCVASTTPTDVVIDLMGVWQAGGIRPASVTPVRLLDSRTGAGVRVAAGQVLTIPVAGAGGLPAGAVGAQVNITSVDTRADGYVTVWPCGQDRPTASNLNPVAGRILANGALVGLGEGGAVCVYSHSSTHLVIDVTGVLVP